PLPGHDARADWPPARRGPRDGQGAAPSGRAGAQGHLPSTGTRHMDDQYTDDTGPDDLNGDPVWTMLADVPAPVADSARMRDRFEGALRHARPAWHQHRGWLQAAAAIAILAAGVSAGRLWSPPTVVAPDPSIAALREELRDMRQMVTLSLLQQR